MVDKLYHRRRHLLQKLDVITDVQEIMNIREELQKIEETLDVGRRIGNDLLDAFDITPKRVKISCAPVGHYGIWKAYLDDKNNPSKIILKCTYCGKQFEFPLNSENLNLDGLLFSEER